MGYANERMSWHPRKAAKAESLEWGNAGYGSLVVLTLLLVLMVAAELRRSMLRWFPVGQTAHQIK